MMSAVLFSGSNCSTFPLFWNYLHERDNYCLRDSLIRGGQERLLLQETIEGGNVNITFQRICFILTNIHLYPQTLVSQYANMQYVSLILGVYCQLEKKISNLRSNKVKQFRMLNLGGGGGELQRILGLFSPVLESIAQNRFNTDLPIQYLTPCQVSLKTYLASSSMFICIQQLQIKLRLSCFSEYAEIR